MAHTGVSLRGRAHPTRPRALKSFIRGNMREIFRQQNGKSFQGWPNILLGTDFKHFQIALKNTSKQQSPKFHFGVAKDTPSRLSLSSCPKAS